MEIRYKDQRGVAELPSGEHLVNVNTARMVDSFPGHERTLNGLVMLISQLEVYRYLEVCVLMP